MMDERNENPYEPPHHGGTPPRQPVPLRITAFEQIVGFTVVGCVTGWLLLPDRFGPFQYPMGRPDVAVGGLAGLFLGVVFVACRRIIG